MALDPGEKLVRLVGVGAWLLDCEVVDYVNWVLSLIFDKTNQNGDVRSVCVCVHFLNLWNDVDFALDE